MMRGFSFVPIIRDYGGRSERLRDEGTPPSSRLPWDCGGRSKPYTIKAIGDTEP